jgi:hypothetical protein
MGREIILLDQADVQVAGTPSPSPGVIFGNFHVISPTGQRRLRRDLGGRRLRRQPRLGRADPHPRRTEIGDG